MIDRDESMKDFAQQLTNVNAQLLELQGSFEKAAAIRFDTEHTVVENRLSRQRQISVDAGDTDTVAQIDEAKQKLDLMRAAATAQGRVNELLVQESRIQSELEVATERADTIAAT